MSRIFFFLFIAITILCSACGDDAPTDKPDDTKCTNASCDSPPPFLENLVGTWTVNENTANPDAVYNFSSPAGEVTFNADGTGSGSVDGFFEGFDIINFVWEDDISFDALKIAFIEDGTVVFEKYIKEIDNDCGEIIIEQAVNIVTDQRRIFSLCRN